VPGARIARPGAAGVLLVLAAAVAIALLVSGSEGPRTTPVEPTAGDDSSAPNVVVVMTDDQAADTMRAMPNARHLIGGKGLRFDNAIVSFPLCCPSRASFLTGQYAHNHGVLDNGGPRGGYQALDAGNTLPVWLSRAGYRTGFVGKFLNGYGHGHAAREVPPGWSDWFALPSDGKRRPFDFRLNENGKLVEYGDDDRDYKTHVLADKSVSFIRERAPGERPFFLWVATNAPHVDYALSEDVDRNPEPDPRDRGRYEGTEPPPRSSVDERDVSDKPRFVRSRARLRARERRQIEKTYVSQLESLVAVDRLVKRVVKELRAQGEFENTVIVFTSDNGFLRGQHRLDSGKATPYEEAIRVPLLIRGPGFPEGGSTGRLVGNVDLAPTILDLADAKAGLRMDGRSILPLKRENDDRAILLEVHERSHGRFVGVRTRRYAYADYDGRDRELYDLRRDPEQLDSVHRDPRYAGVRARLAERLRQLRNCAGASCRR
jgi:N-acetylglucosamine-6-sulfatase